nr:EamA family transporter [uncultured Rhodoferax sp.]
MSTKLKRFYLVGFLVLMAFDALTQISIKLAGSNSLPLEFSEAWLLRVLGQPWLYGALLGYIGAFFTWMTLLRHAPIGPAFAASHLEIVAVLILSSYLFDEQITSIQMLGGLFIVAGIVCLAFGESQETTHPPKAPPGH